MLRVLFLSGRGTIRSVLPKTSPISPRLFSTAQSSDVETKTDIKPLEKKSEPLPDHARSSDISEYQEQFNEKALLDLCLEKFDDDLLYFPEILNDEQWGRLIDKGRMIEESIHRLNYNEVLSTGKISKDLRKQLGELDLFRLSIPEEYGGLGYKNTECKYIHEIVGYCPSIARMISENEEMGVKVLVKYGTEEQKRKYLPRIASGEVLVACAFLEDTSTMLDPKSYFGLEVIPVEGDFFLKGKKNWVYNANDAELFLVLGCHRATDDKGTFLLNTLFLVDRAADGVRVHKPMEKKWFRGFDICEVIFDEVKVGPESIVGGFGRGFDVLSEVMKLNKTGTNAECSASMKRLLHDAIDKCNNYKFMDRPLSELKHTEFLIGELSALTYAVESVTYYLSARSDFYISPNLSFENFMAKIFVSETVAEALNIYFGLLGRHGYKKGSFVEELVQNAYYYSVTDDTNFDMKLYIMSNATIYAATALKEKYKIVRNPQDNPLPALKRLFFHNDAEGEEKPKLELSKCVHRTLWMCANDLEYCINRLACHTEKNIFRWGRKTLEYDYELLNLGSMYINIYALIASIARASRATHLKLPNSEMDVSLANTFSSHVLNKVRRTSLFLGRSSEETEGNAEVARKSFTNKRYIAEHPLMRNF